MEELRPLVGTWTTEATHPAMPGVVVPGTAEAQWLEGERFLIMRTRNDHADFPDAIWILGATETDRVPPGAHGVEASRSPSAVTMHYFDSRGVFRVYETRVDIDAWRWWRDAPGFSQRFVGTFDDDGDTIRGISQLCTDDTTWNDDLAITYRRRT